MSNILNEVRSISSQKIAEKIKLSEQRYPKLIEDIKLAAGRGKTSCEFNEGEIDEHSKRLLEADGFIVFATTKMPDTKYDYYLQRKDPYPIWRVQW